MITFWTALIAVALFALTGGVATSEAATNFNGSTIIAVDQNERTVTFRTKDGEKWTLPVENPDLVKDGRVKEGEQVSIELDLDDRITKILKPSDFPGTGQREAREDGSQ